MIDTSLEIGETIAESFADQDVLITGVTGFLGKVILEKLLRCCPQVGTVYLLLRQRKSLGVHERLEQLKRFSLFENLLKMQPNVFDKLQIIEGDVSEKGLGLKSDDRQRLIDRTTIILHGAATVRFDDSMQKAVIINLRGTKELLDLAVEMTRLQVFLHISTAYTNTDHPVIEERVYWPRMDWKLVIEMIDKIPESKLQLITSLILGPLPNTYAFTKSLAENLVNDYADRVPVCIVRPSVVTATYRDPIPGWVDNFNGPIGMTFGVGIGLVHVLYIKRDTLMDYIPADYTVNIIMASAWYRKNSSDKKTLVVNACASNDLPITIEMVIQFCEKLHNALPFKTRIWYEFSLYTNCEYWYRILFVAFHVIPAFFIDNLAKFTKQKKSLMKIYRKMIFANLSLVYYVRNQWTFRTENLQRLNELLPGTEKLTFECDVRDANAVSVVIGSLINGRKFLLNEQQKIDSQLMRNYIVYRRYKYLHYGIVILFWYMLWQLIKLTLFYFDVVIF